MTERLLTGKFSINTNKHKTFDFYSAGGVWTKNLASFEHFSIEVVFKVTGRGRVGADGLVRTFLDQYEWSSCCRYRGSYMSAPLVADIEDLT